MEGLMVTRKGYVDSAYLQAAGKLAMPVKQKSYQMMRVREGHKVLDVGCGPGIDTINLAKLVKEGGEVIGVDFDEEMVETANKNAQSAGVSDWVSHRPADATQLPFESNVFDACRSERVFQHLQEPDLALEEIIRVTKPGGWIVVVDTDWSTLSADTSEPEIARRLWDFNINGLRYNGYSGRKLFRMFKQQMLMDIEVEPYVFHSTDYRLARWMIMADELEQKALEEGILTTEELNQLAAGFEKANEEGAYFGTVGGVMVAGRKP